MPQEESFLRSPGKVHRLQRGFSWKIEWPLLGGLSKDQARTTISGGDERLCLLHQSLKIPPVVSLYLKRLY